MEEASEVISTDSPLTSESGGVFDDFVLSGNEFKACVRLGIIQPIVNSRHQAVRLVFDVTAGSKFIIDHNSLPLRFISVPSYEVEIILVTVENAAGNQRNRAREYDLVEKSGSLVCLSISGGIL